MSDFAAIGPGGRESRPRPLLRTALGNVLRRQRLAQKRTLAEVAGAAIVSVPYLSEVERGRKEVSSEVLAALCHALRLELADVLTEAGRDLAASRDLAAGRSTVITLSPARRPTTIRSGDAGEVLCLAA